LQRLKTRAQFQAVLAGTTVARSEHFALHRSELPLQSDSVAEANESGQETKDMLSEPRSQPLFPVLDLWMGAMVPKRWAKRAVTRNAIKRQIYTVSAVFSPQHRQAAFVVRLRRDFSRKVYLSASSDQLKQVVRTELLSLMRDGARHA
jgi:ribonuclease P protein component